MRRFGIKRVGSKLNELYTVKDKNIPTLIKNRIFDEITISYGMSLKKVLMSKERGNVTQAKVMTMILLLRHMNTSRANIASLFGLHVRAISHRLNSFNRVVGNSNYMDRYSKMFFENDFMEKLEKIDKNINEFKEKLNG